MNQVVCPRPGMIRYFVTYVALNLLLLLLTGCVGESISITGVWERQIEAHIVRMRFEAAGTFTLRVGEQERGIEGEYQIQRDVVVVTDEDCKEIEGKYRIDHNDPYLSFLELNDACEGRADVIGGEWKKVLNQ